MEEQDEEQEEEDEAQRREESKKKVFHFEYDVRTQTLRQLEDWEEPDNHPRWANVSPDGEKVIFGRNHNLYMMNREGYQQILDARRGKTGEEADKADQKIEVDEMQLTTDGEKDYSYAVFDRGDTDDEREKNQEHRKRTNISWSRDSGRFSTIRTDRRKSGDLWVIHSVGNKRPQLETYKYDLPGEKNVGQPEALIYDLAAREMVTVKDEGFKDQRLSTSNARQFIYPDSDEPRRTLWLGARFEQGLPVAAKPRPTPDRCLHRRCNYRRGERAGRGTPQYIRREQQSGRLKSGDLIWWSERDGWAHLYRYGSDGELKNRLTEGPWSVRRVMGIDEDNGVVFFLANGPRAGRRSVLSASLPSQSGMAAVSSSSIPATSTTE